LATGYWIYKALVTIFGDDVDIIDPLLSSIHSPADSTFISGVVNYTEVIEEIIKKDGIIKKPQSLLMRWPARWNIN
jgi:hypothetical protein